MISLSASISLFCIFFYSASFVLADHYWHKSDASLHVQPSSWAYRQGREAGRLLAGEGGVWGGETWRTQAQGQKPPHLAALPDQIHRRGHGWVTQNGYFLWNQTNICTSVQFTKERWAINLSVRAVHRLRTDGVAKLTGVLIAVVRLSCLTPWEDP